MVAEDTFETLDSIATLPVALGQKAAMESRNRTPEDTSKNSIQSYKPQLVGTTLGEYDEKPTQQTGNVALKRESSNFFKSLQWSTDGTSILTSSADNDLRSFILPPTLLEPPQPHVLKPYTIHQLPEPAHATALYPSYSLSDPSTCLFLASPRNLPIRLYSSLGGGVLGSYPLVSPTTEAFIAPHSLLFPSSDRNTFLAGSNAMIAVFDISRSGEGPVTVMRTGQKRRSRSGALGFNIEAGYGLKGIISAMAVSRDGVLAAGTFGKNVGLYDDHGLGDVTAVFSIRDDADTETHGNGVTELFWDESGRYLCVAERNSDGVSVWDIRGTGKRLAWLKGRKAITSQRMGVTLIGEEIWAGGSDGCVRVWQKVGAREGMLEGDWEFNAHGDVVSGIGLHPGGSVLATCSGQRHDPELESDAGDSNSESRASEPDNSLKLWAL